MTCRRRTNATSQTSTNSRFAEFDFAILLGIRVRIENADQLHSRRRIFIPLTITSLFSLFVEPIVRHVIRLVGFPIKQSIPKTTDRWREKNRAEVDPIFLILISQIFQTKPMNRPIVVKQPGVLLWMSFRDGNKVLENPIAAISQQFVGFERVVFKEIFRVISAQEFEFVVNFLALQSGSER